MSHTPEQASPLTPMALGSLSLCSDWTPWSKFTAPLCTTCATHLSLPFLICKMGMTILLNRTMRVHKITHVKRLAQCLVYSEQWPLATNTTNTNAATSLPDGGPH